VITSHDPRSALEEADVVLALRDGRASYLGDPATLDTSQLYA
jgi:hypothetical protein